MKQSFLQGTLFVTVATFLSKVIGSLFRIPLQNIAGDEVLGIFTLVYPLYMVVLTLSVGGIPLAISKLIAEARVREKANEVREIYLTASFLAVIFGFIGFVIMVGFSGPLSSLIGGPSTQPAILAVSLTLVIAPYMAVYRGYFQGYGDMRPTSFSQVLEQFIRVGIILVLAFVLTDHGFSESIISAGVMSGSVVGAIFSLFYLRWQYMRSSIKTISNSKFRYPIFVKWSKRILNLSIPIAIGSLMMALLNLVDSFTIPTALKSFGQTNIIETYGIYGRGMSLVQIATVFSTALVSPMVPAISESIALKNWGKTSRLITRVDQLNQFVSFPAAIGILALALPINRALFGDIQGSDVLALLGATSLFNSFAVLNAGILTGIGLQRISAVIILLGVVIKIPLNLLFVSQYGLIGTAYASFVIYGIVFIWNALLIHKRFPYPIFAKHTGVYLLGTCVMGAIIGLPTLYFNVDVWSRSIALLYVVIAVVVGAAIYFAIVFKINGIEELKRIPLLGKWIEKRTSRGQ